METNSTLIRNSRYVSGGTTEVNKTAIEWWDRQNFYASSADTAYVVEQRWVGRLDLIANAFLGDSRYWWIIAMHNNILDPYAEVLEGSIIYIPPADKAKALISGKLGGVESTRVLTPSILPIV